MWPCFFIQKKELCSTQLLIKKKANNYWGFDKRLRYRKSEFLHYSHREGNGTPLQSSCLENPWTEEPGGLQSMGSRRVGHDWATSLSLFTFMHWRRKWQPTPVLAWRIPGTGNLVGCRLWGRRVGHGWGDLAAAADTTPMR